MTKEFFLQKSKNIGSLIIFLSNKRNYEYLNYLNERVPEEIIHKPIAEKVYYYLNDIQQQLLCICGEHLKFIGFKNGYRKTCGKKDCFVASRRNTCLDIYGVDNPKKSEMIKEREMQSILTKWNGRHYLYDESVRSKFKSTKSTAVVGACSKLINVFLKKLPNSEIIVRSDFSNSNGDLWRKMGFTFKDFLLPVLQTRYNGKPFDLYDCGYQIWKR